MSKAPFLLLNVYMHVKLGKKGLWLWGSKVI